MKTSAIAIATLLASCSAGAAQATTTTARKVYQQVVRFGDLNLANEADAAILHDRIKIAGARSAARARSRSRSRSGAICTPASRTRRRGPLLNQRADPDASGPARGSQHGHRQLVICPWYRGTAVRWSTFAILLIVSCATAAKERPSSRTASRHGQPDMQGVWIASNVTPLQRPPGFSTLVIDETQAAKLLAALDARAEDRNTPTEPTEYFDAVSIEPIRGQLRSSLIVDPPNGLVPGNDLYKQHIAQAMANVLTAMNGPEHAPLRSAASPRRPCNRRFSRSAPASTCIRSCRRQTSSCSRRNSSTRRASSD